ncbi:10103_t:CDS:2, partial [Gigaspora margarita]
NEHDDSDKTTLIVSTPPGTEKIIQVIFDSIQEDELNSDSLKDVLPKQNHLTEISATGRGQKFSLVPLLTLAKFVIQYNDIKNGNSKIGKKKVKDHFSKNSNIEFTDDNRNKDKSINDSSDDLPETKVTKSQTFNSSSSKVKVSISTESQISDSSDSAQASMTVLKKLPELLLKNGSDIDALIILLRQKFKILEERLEQWRANIAFELRDNNNYWKERESMSEADFLEHKQNFEAKMGVPTTPHK